MSKCKKDGNTLRQLLARAKRSSMLQETHLRWCDECDTIYILKPEELTPEEMEIPLLEYQGLHQVEVI